MKKLFPLWVLVAQLCGVSSCVKNPPDPSPVYLPKETKARFSFQKGSYWIYRDSVSGREDSFYVFDMRTHLYSMSQATGNPGYEVLEISIHQKLNLPVGKPDSVYIWNFSVGARAVGGRYYQDTYLFDLPDCTYPFVSDDRSLLLSTFDLGGHVFSTVSKVSNTHSTIWMNDSVGYVKMDIVYDLNSWEKAREVWELQRWHVIK